MKIEDLSEKQLKEAIACTSPEELLDFSKSEGIELSDEDLELVTGGGAWTKECYSGAHKWDTVLRSFHPGDNPNVTFYERQCSVCGAKKYFYS